jgi:hypothetical protein
VHALIDWHVLRDSAFIVDVVPASLSLNERDEIGTVTVNFVSTHKTEGGVSDEVSGGGNQIQRADGINVEVLKRNLGRLIVRRLSSAVNNEVRPHFTDEVPKACTITNIKTPVTVSWEIRDKTVNCWLRRGCRAEEPSSHVTVNSHDIPTILA